MTEVVVGVEDAQVAVAVDDVAVHVVVTGPAGPPGGRCSGAAAHTIQDEGAALTTRAGLNFVGAGVTATDDSANNRTVVTIPGGGGLDQATADARYINATGDTMTGPLIMMDGSKVQNATGPATQTVDGTPYAGQYYDIAGKHRFFVGADDGAFKIGTFDDAGSVETAKALTYWRGSGDMVIGGKLTLGYPPTSAMDAATKDYVDTHPLVAQLLERVAELESRLAAEGGSA